MGIRLNLFCNKQIAATQEYLDNFDKVDWPDAPKRDALGILIKEDGQAKGERDETTSNRNAEN
nr:hypothetical protein 12 [bacterium]